MTTEIQRVWTGTHKNTTHPCISKITKSPCIDYGITVQILQFLTLDGLQSHPSFALEIPLDRLESCEWRDYCSQQWSNYSSLYWIGQDSLALENPCAVTLVFRDLIVSLAKYSPCQQIQKLKALHRSNQSTALANDTRREIFSLTRALPGTLRHLQQMVSISVLLALQTLSAVTRLSEITLYMHPQIRQ